MRKNATKRKLSTVLSGLAAVVALGTGAACIPSGDGTISACRRSDGNVRLIDAEGGDTCPSGETLVEWNQQGPVGPAGPQGPTGVIDVVYAHGHGWNPSTQLDRIGVLATVDVPTGATVNVVATKVVGTLGNSEYAILDAWVCHRPAGTDRTALVTVGPAHNVQLWSRERTALTLSAPIEGLPAGQHEVGLCAQATSLNWNDNSQSSVTATVLTGS